MRDRQMQGAQLASWTLLGAVLAVLLISCANVANLLLARSASRQTELAIRAALGISRARLLRQMLTESLLLALAGCVLGCALAAILLRLLIAAAPQAVPLLLHVSLDARILAFSFVLSLAAGLLFGLAPALQHPRAETLAASSRVAPRSSTFLKNALVAGQIALSTVLLASAGLLVRSLWNLETQPLGMTPEHVLTAQFVLPSSRYTKPDQRIALFNQIEQQLAAIPGIRASGISDSLPPGGWQRSRPLFAIEIPGQPHRYTGADSLVEWRYVSPGYFDVLHIPVLAGRAFDEADRRPGRKLCLLSRSLAQRLFPYQNPIGRQLSVGEVIGIVPDVKNSGLSAPTNPEYYILRTHTPDDTYLNATGTVAQRTLGILVRSGLPDRTLSTQVQQKIAALDPTLPVQFQSMHGRLSDLAAGPRFNALLLLSFALTGLALAAIGLYGTIAFLVTQRRQEIGIRMSLGATPAAIAGLMLAHSAKWTLLGAAIGAAAALATTRLLSSLLFQVSPRDPVTLLASLFCLIVVGLLAAVLPARNAAATDPAITLRA